MFGSHYLQFIIHLFEVPFTADYFLMDITEQNVMRLAEKLFWQALLLVAPVFIVAIIMGVFGNYVQYGFLFTTKVLEPKLEKIDPIQGAKKIFSMRSLVELVKSLLKLSVIGGITFFILWGQIEEIISLSKLSVASSFYLIADLTVRMGLIISLALIVLGFFDFLYQRYEHEKNLRMSKQDIKDEHKKTEGDPLIKSKIRERQRQMAMRRMMSEVPKADVVITNPTHFAVALQYDPERMAAPTVIAKGQDYIALKIKETAKQHHLTMMENKPLARALYARVEIGEPVPEDLFQAVAEVLAYVYRLQGKTN